MPGADRPPHVQVLGEEAGGDHPHPVVHPALAQQLAHRRVDDGVAGASLAPGLDGLAAVVVVHPRQRGAQVVPRRLRVVPQDVGVELAPGQLGREPVGSLAEVPAAVREVGQEGAGVHGPDLEVRRQPRHPVEVGPVAVGAVVGQRTVAEVGPPLEGGRLARGGQSRQAFCLAGVLEGVEGRLVGPHLRQAQGLRLRGRSGPAVLAPRLREGREDLVLRARAVAHRTRPHGIRGAGLDPGDAGLAERCRHGAVAASPRGRGLAGDVDGTCAQLRGQCRDHLHRVTLPHAEPPFVCRVGGLEALGQPGTAGVAGALPQRGVEHEDDGHLARPGARGTRGRVMGRTQGREVATAQVPAQPEDARRRHAALLSVGWPGRAGRVAQLPGMPTLTV